MSVTLKVLQDTYFKLSTAQSSSLSDNEKILIPKGTEYEVDSEEPAENGHVKVTLTTAKLSPQSLNIWYIFSDHVEIEGTEEENQPQDQPEAQTTKISTLKSGPIKLPGHSSTFYLSDPIIEGGHFSWAEATHNGTRIPVSKDIVENIIKIAKCMEEVREYLGGRAITVNSWYRDPVTNRKVGGASQSRHMVGDAIDFTAAGMHPSEVHKKIEPWWGNRGGIASASCFTHIDARGYRARWTYGF